MALNIRQSVGEGAVGLGLAAIGAAFTVMSHRLPASTDPGVPGAGGAPLVLGLILIALGLTITARGLMSGGGLTVVLAERKALLSVVLLAACLLMLESAGFMLASFLFLFVGFWKLGGVAWRASFAAAAVASGGLWLLFTKALGVGLPYGELSGLLFR